MGTGTELITERAIGVDRPLPEEQVLDLLHRYFICPYCGNISRLFAVNEFYGEDGRVVGREYYLSCYDVEDLPPDEARNGTLPLRKVHHRVSDLGELEEVRITRTKPNVEVFLHAYNYDAGGRPTQRLIQRSDSFLPNFIGMLYSQMNAPYDGSGTSGSGPNIGGTNEAFINNYTGVHPNENIFATNDGSGDASYGIQVGTGTAANSTSTYALASQIANGTGSGQLYYGSHSYTWSTGSTNTIVTRTFINQSGASITVSEVGLVWESNYDGPYAFLMIRDVLSSSFTVANGGSFVAQYTISITVS
ncbi:MAG: hypothetical protein RXR82_00340 [Nitrososphaeria archaeon]